MGYKVEISQKEYRSYDRDGEKVEYFDTKTIVGECTDFEMLSSLIGVITSTFKDAKITISSEVNDSNKEDN